MRCEHVEIATPLAGGEGAVVDRALRVRNSATKCAFLAPVIARRLCKEPLISQHFSLPCHAEGRGMRIGFAQYVGPPSVRCRRKTGDRRFAFPGAQNATCLRR